MALAYILLNSRLWWSHIITALCFSYFRLQGFVPLKDVIISCIPLSMCHDTNSYDELGLTTWKSGPDGYNWQICNENSVKRWTGIWYVKTLQIRVLLLFCLWNLLADKKVGMEWIFLSDIRFLLSERDTRWPIYGKAEDQKQNMPATPSHPLCGAWKCRIAEFVNIT